MSGSGSPHLEGCLCDALQSPIVEACVASTDAQLTHLVLLAQLGWSVKLDDHHGGYTSNKVGMHLLT